MSNPFDLLGNDVEDASDVQQVVPREVVKKTTSSKKTDAPPASANAAKARGNKKSATGNEAAFKDKNTGRSANKNLKVDDKASQRKTKPRTDRQARSARTDSDKKVKQAGWTADAKGELEAEAEGAEDAEEELEAEAEPKEVKKSYADFLAEQAANNAAKPAASGRTIEQVSEEDIIVKEQGNFIESTKTKTTKQKATKTKQYLDFGIDEPEQSAPKPRASNNTRGGKGPRGRGGARGGARGAARGGSTVKPQFNESNFPSL